MLRDDALLAFERHATSKLSDVKDLLSIATLGFRGEALPSIASVSRLLLETRACRRDHRSRGRIRRRKDPALRRAFRASRNHHHGSRSVLQRSGAQEIPAVRSNRARPYRFAGHALQPGASQESVPTASRQRLHLLDVTPVETLRERVYQVFGSQTLEDLIDLDDRRARAGRCRTPDDRSTRVFALRGFVSGPQVQKLNRNSIFLFVNGRLIRDRLLLHALSSAYHNLMPPACYPFALLFLDCDCEEVDVNVHPSKTEVRFRHGSFVHDFVRDTIRERLIATRPASSIPVLQQPQPAADLPFSDFTQRIENQRFEPMPSDRRCRRSASKTFPIFTLNTNCRAGAEV